MSGPRYFIRFRGRVSGPYSGEQLQALHQRGQFGRFHEVSEDRQTWVAATTLARLFPPTAADPAEAADVEVVAPVQTPAAASWFYLDGGARRGPVSWDELQRLREAGTVHDRTLVCRPGMPQWQALGELAGPAVPTPGMLTDFGRETQRQARKPRSLFLIAFASVGCLMLLLLGAILISAFKEPTRSGAVGGDTTEVAAFLFFLMAVLVLLALGIAFYFLPTFIAFHRGHHNAPAIAAVNVLFGWLCVGWGIALVWAFTEVRKKENPYYRSHD